VQQQRMAAARILKAAAAIAAVGGIPERKMDGIGTGNRNLS